MGKVEYAKSVLGNLVKQTRASTMDQSELALRTGTSKNTISRLERGNGVNSDTLFTVLNQLDILDPLLEVIEQQQALVKRNPLRKGTKGAEELPNDF